MPVEHAVPQSVINAAPAGMVYIHLAWFDRRGWWIGEWAGYLPQPPALRTGERTDDREQRMAAWLDALQAQIVPYAAPFQTIAEEWDGDARAAIERSGEQVCLDVTRFGWPVGDHVWHRWINRERLLDWGPEHTFIELRLDTLAIVANQTSHRPVRSAVPGQVVIDITGTPWEAFHGDLFGRFVREGDRMRFIPDAGTSSDRLLGAAMPDVVIFELQQREHVLAGRAAWQS